MNEVEVALEALMLQRNAALDEIVNLKVALFHKDQLIEQLQKEKESLKEPSPYETVVPEEVTA